MYSLLTAIVALAVGSAVLWANPRRFTNQIFFALALLMGATMSCLLAASIAATHDNIPRALFLIRLYGALSTLVPALFFILKDSVTERDASRLELIRRSWRWLAAAGIGFLVCFSPSYVPPESTPARPLHGPAYYLVIIFLIGSFIAFLVRTQQDLRRTAGIRRLELQFLALNLALAALVVSVVSLIAIATHYFPLRRVGLLAIAFGYVSTVWGIAWHRVFDVRQVLASMAHHGAVIAAFVVGVVVLDTGFVLVLPAAAGLGAAVVVSFCFAAFWLEPALRKTFDRDGARQLAALRQEAIALAWREPALEQMTAALEAFLAARSDATFVRLEFEGGADVSIFTTAGLDGGLPAFAGLLAQGWTTPESLERGRPLAGTAELRQVLREQHIGLAIAVPAGSAKPSLTVVFGTKTNQWPFTYPEIQRLQNLAELIDNILTHSRLANQAAMKARMEHMAIMSRGLAHDLKNMMTPMASFLVHAERNLPSDGIEREVHTAAKRSAHVMSEYVREVVSFADNLAPTFARLAVRPLLLAVRDACQARADSRGAELVVAAPADEALWGDSVLLQRMLANLANNAIDASHAGGRITFAAFRTESPAAGFRLQVIDEGEGIAPEHLCRIFEPYFTTKGADSVTRGRGLGLTVAQKIVRLHRGTIDVESEPGRGTCVSVTLPATLDRDESGNVTPPGGTVSGSSRAGAARRDRSFRR